MGLEVRIPQFLVENDFIDGWECLLFGVCGGGAQDETQGQTEPDGAASHDGFMGDEISFSIIFR